MVGVAARGVEVGAGALEVLSDAFEGGELGPLRGDGDVESSESCVGGVSDTGHRDLKPEIALAWRVRGRVPSTRSMSWCVRFERLMSSVGRWSR